MTYISSEMHFKDVSMILIETTSKCNMRCNYCYNSAQSSSKELGYSTLVLFAIELNELGLYPKIALSGGEFLTRSDYEKIIKLFHKNFQLSIATNGLALNQETIKTLEKYDIFNIQVSIDGITDEANRQRNLGTESVMKNILRLKESKFKNKISLRATVHKENYTQLEALIAFCIALKLELRIGFLDFVRGNTSTNSLLLSSKEMIYVRKLITKLNYLHSTNIGLPDIYVGGFCDIINKQKSLNMKINSSGDVYACQAAMTKDFVIGNINVSSFSSIINESNFTQLYQRILMREKLLSISCSACKIHDTCRGKCIAQIANETGSIINCLTRYREVAEFELD